MNGIGKRNKNVNFESINCFTEREREIKHICMEYVDQMPHCQNLLFTGDVGTGKTMHACAMINELDSRRFTGAIRTINEIVMQMDRVRSFSVSQHATDVLSALIEIDFLVIDEVGLQKGTDSEMLLLDMIVDGRYKEMKPTGIISNYSATEIQKLIGDRVASRFKSELTQVVFNVESKR